MKVLGREAKLKPFCCRNEERLKRKKSNPLSFVVAESVLNQNSKNQNPPIEKKQSFNENKK